VSEPATARRVYRIVAMLWLAGAAAGCGYKGPLYMPPGSGGAAQTQPQDPDYPDDGLQDDDLFPSDAD